MSVAADPVPDPGPPAPAASTPNADRPWRRAWLTGLVTWAIAQVTYLLVNAMYWTVTAQAPPRTADVLSVWFRFDVEWYLLIADQGYTASNHAGFFPLYPILVAIVDVVLPGGPLAAGMAVASAACVAALAVICRLVEDLVDRGTAQRTVVYLMAWPFGFYLVAAYNESLFIALCVASLYCMRRGLWWYAGIFAGLASATRYFGVVLGLAFVIEYLRQRGWRANRVRWDALAVLLVPTGAIAFMIYSARRFGDPLQFARNQEEGWGHEFSPPWRGIVDTIRQIVDASATSPLDPIAVLNMIDLLTVPVVVALLVLAVVGPWRLGPQAWYLVAFGATSLLLVLLSPMVTGLPPLHGLPRYALEILPVFIVLGRLGARPVFDRAYLFPALILQGALLIGFFASIYLS